MRATSYDDIREFIETALRRREESSERPHVAPSLLWNYVAENFAYVSRLDDEELRRIRFHCYHLTGDIYQTYLFKQPAISRRLGRDYASIDRELGGFVPDEGDSDFGCEVDGHFISIDLLRYMQVVVDLVSADVFPRERHYRILEIGGGYGGLAAVCMTYNPNTSYIICDLEETMFFQAIYLANRFGFDSLELCEGDALSGETLAPGRFYFLPQSQSNALTSVSVDLAVNQQSLQEMTEEQVHLYFDLIKDAARFFYSCNLDAHKKSLVSRTELVRNLQKFTDEAFPKIRWRTEPPRGLRRLDPRILSHRRRTGDRNLRRVVYEI